MSFREALRSGKFLITMDTIPPKGIHLSRLLHSLEGVRSRVDGINVADMPTAAMRLGSLPVCHVLKEEGFEPILQMTCRDRNRLALQADLLGAAVLGIENVLILGGDDVSLSDHPGAKGVYDLDSVRLLAAARGLERGVDMAGHAMQGSPRFCLGASLNPGATSWAEEIEEMRAKAEAGAEFFQTQPVYDVEAFTSFLARSQAAQINVPILAGVFLLKSARMARYMNDHIPEVAVPSWVIRALETAPDAAVESLRIAARIVQEVRQCCAGVHIMTVNWEEKVPALLDAAGL